jgi:membrane protease YdiL (CAAX protease family)
VAAAAPRVSPGRALLWVLAAGVLAQLSGLFVASFARVWVAGSASAASDPALAAEPRVVLPAMVASALALLLVVVLVPPLTGVPFRVALGLWRARPITYVAAALGTIMLGPTADVLMRAMDALFPTWTLGVLPLLDRLVSQASPLWVLPVFALMPGVSEELLFRGLLQRAFAPGVRAILISGIGFALFHLDPHHVVGVLPLGLFLAWVGSRAGTVVTMFAHVMNNAAAVLAVHVESMQVGYLEEQPMPPYWVPASLAVVAVCALVIHRAAPARA